MALESDSRGFLVGDPIDLKRMPNDISHIRDDVSAIRRAIAERGRNFSRTDRAPRPNAVMPERGANGRFVSSASPAVATPTGPRKGDSNLAARFAGNAKVIALPAARSAGVVSSISARLAPADPSVKAAREIAEPLQRGFELFRGGDKQTGWLKKIFKSLNIFHKEDSAYNKAAKKSLKAIEEKSVMGGGAYRSGSLVDKIPDIAKTGFATIARTGVTGGLLGLLTKAGRGAKSIFKRIPVIGSLLAGAGAAFDIFNSENDDTLSRRDKDRLEGKAIGGWAGSLGGIAAGAAAGSAFGPVGTILGGVVGGFLGDQAGQVIGEKFGGWVNDLRKADIPGKITAAWDSAVSAMSKTFNEAWAKVKDVGGLVMAVIREQLGGFADYVKGVTGIDLKQQGSAWMDRTKANIKQAAATLVDKTMQGVDWMGKNTTVGKAAKAAKAEGLKRIFENADGTTETREGGTVAWRNNNPGNLEYGDFAKRHGAIASDGRFAIFPSLEAGRKAKENLLFNTESYRGRTLSQSIAAYAPSNENDTKAYQKAVIAAAGGDKLMSEYTVAERSAILSAIEAREGFKPGTVQVSGPRISAPPKAPSMPPIAEAPKVVEPLSSPTPPQFTVNIPSPDVGQDVRDRRIAHIASGGISRL